MDPTENYRRAKVAELNSQVETDDEHLERSRLKELYGEVWDTAQLQEDFVVIGFMAPYVVVRNKKTNERGSLMFQHYPRLYFKWHPM